MLKNSPENFSPSTHTRAYFGTNTYHSELLRLHPFIQRAMDQILAGLRGVVCYLDDILLACYTSPYGVGAVSSHILPNGQERPIAFAFRSLSKAEANYAQIEREALSMVFGGPKLYQYIFGWKFTLLTDHHPITTMFGPHHGIPSLAASRMQRWALLLSDHTYDIKYQKSELHRNADGLSRLPLADRV